MPGALSRLFLENVQPAPRRGGGGWHGGPTPVGAVRGVSPEQASWRPGPRRKSIWELMLHIAYWDYAVRRRLESPDTARGGERFPRTPANWPKQPRADARAWAADVALLRTEHERLLAAIAAIPESRLHVRVPHGKRWSYGELILGIAQHDAYHTGQIQLVKRLWAERAR